MIKRVTNSCEHKRCRTRITKIKIMTTRRVINSCNEERGEGRRWSTWGSWPRGSRTTTCTKNARWRSLITTTKKVVNNYSEKGWEGIQWSICVPQPRRSQTTTSTRDARWGPPRSRSWWLGRLPTVAAKKEQAWNAWALSDSTQKLYQ